MYLNSPAFVQSYSHSNLVGRETGCPGRVHLSAAQKRGKIARSVDVANDALHAGEGVVEELLLQVPGAVSVLSALQFPDE